MRFVKPEKLRIALACGLLLTMVAGLGLVPWKVVAAQPREVGEAPNDTTLIGDKAPAKETSVSGRLVSFKEGMLRIKVKVPGGKEDETKEHEFKVADNTRTISFIRDTAKDGTARDAFKLWEPGAMVSVKAKEGKITIIEIGVKKTATDKVPDKTSTKTPDRVPEKTSDNVPSKTPDRVPEKAPDKTPEKPAAKTAQAEKTERGRFVSFKDDVLTIQANNFALLETKVSASTKTLVWDDGEKLYKPADTAEALSQAKAGAWFMVHVGSGDVTVRIGSRKGVTTGTFVSFKDSRLLILGTSLGESYTKKYGNNLHLNKFRDDVPAYESVDGGEYKLIGTANKVLGNVKEGTIITVHGEGDDNITLVQIGVPKKN